ncbi:MAG: hypothetical protein NTY55_04765 [Flavobacteriia bacterium]|nr:hypothetical protein [Flavobacteriia bacterium]
MKKKKEKSSILMHSDLVRMAQLFPPKNESEHIKKNVDVANEKIENKYTKHIEITFIRNLKKG